MKKILAILCVLAMLSMLCVPALAVEGVDTLSIVGTGLPLIGLVPEDNDVVLAAAFGKPLITYTKRGAARACRAIARRIQGLNTPLSF